MSRCPPRCCAGCRQEARQERISHKAQIRRKESCSSGPTPEFHHDTEDTEDAEDVEDMKESLDQGDRIFAMGIFLPHPPEDICASSTISTRLAEAFKVNSAATLLSVPDYLQEFKDVFSKKSFDVLPEHKDWDHAIELIPGEKAAGCKVYPLAPSKQKELDLFLKENLETGRIRLSKSPMSSPVFFIKKKDSSLQLVQDYRALNAITMKNKYPLPLISELINKLQGARYFTKLDVRWGFNNVRMKDGDEWKAAFCTNRGLFEPLVMFFGLTNSPATFQTMMDDVFEDMISEGKAIYSLLRRHPYLQKSANSNGQRWNILESSSLTIQCGWIPSRCREWRIGPSPPTKRKCNPFLDSLTFTDGLSKTFPIMPVLYSTSLKMMLNGSGISTSGLPSNFLKEKSSLPPS